MTRFSEIQASSIQSRKPAHFTSLPSFLPIFLITWWFNLVSLNCNRAILSYTRSRAYRRRHPHTKINQPSSQRVSRIQQVSAVRQAVHTVYIACEEAEEYQAANITNLAVGREYLLKRLKWKDNILLLLTL